MLADLTIKNYYLQFIYGAKVDINKYNTKLNSITKEKIKLYNYINEHKDIIRDSFNINLDNAIEYITKCYNKSETLYNIAIKCKAGIDKHPKRTCILKLIKYCNILRNENRYKTLIKVAEKRKQIKFNTYRNYITAYYNQVHKCVLGGMGYKFGGGIGTYVINHWKMDAKLKKKNHIDYVATNAKRKQLLKEGKKLYDEKEALWYKTRNIPYDGVDYRVYKDSADWYEITFIKSNIVRKSMLEYKHPEYVNIKYRGITHETIAKQFCKTEEDIYNLQVDIKVKLNILLYKYPEKYINFIRNAEECKYKYRENNS